MRADTGQSPGQLLVGLSLGGLLITSTMNGFSIDVGVFGTTVTIRPDQVVLAVMAPVLGVVFLVGRLQVRPILFDWLVAGFVCSNVLASLFVSPSRGASLKGTLLLGSYAAMYFVVRLALANRVDWVPRASNWVLGLGVAQAAYSLSAVVLYWFGYGIGGLQIGHIAQASVATRGTFWEANLLGAYLGLIALFSTARFTFRSAGDSGRTPLLALFLASLARPLTVTRAAVAGFLLGLVAIALVVWLYKSEIAAWKTRTAAVLVTLVSVLVLTVTATNSLVSSASGYPNMLIERWALRSWIAPSDRAAREIKTQRSGPALAAPTAEGRVPLMSRSSVVGRIDAWKRAVEAWKERPLLGHGTLAGTTVIHQGWWYGSAIQALYDTGLLGLTALLCVHIGAVVYPVRAWLRNRGSPIGASLLGFAVANVLLLFTSQFSSFLFLGFPWVFWGLSVGTSYACSRGGRRLH